MSSILERSICQFSKATEEFAPALVHATFSYFAVKKDDRWQLIQGRILLNYYRPRDLSLTHYHSSNVSAGQYLLLSELCRTPKDLLTEICSGTLKTPHGEFHFPPTNSGSYGCTFEPFHPIGQLNRVGVLTLAGDYRETVFDRTAVEWELRGGETPYENIQDLLSQYRIAYGSGACSVEAVSPAAVEVDLSLNVSGTEASVGLLVTKDLLKEKTSLGYRVLSNNLVIERGRILGEQFDWTESEGICRGSARIEVPLGSIIQCFAAYAGQVQHSGWIADSSNYPNPRRSIFDQFDKELGILQEILRRVPGKGVRSDDFEAAVSWLLWMHGFSVALLGTTSLMKEAPDLIATTPAGHHAVVECTMGLLKVENKLAKVVARATQVRERLERSGSGHLTVLPVMVTSLSRKDVAAELEQAARHGVHVITKEGIEAAITSTALYPDAERYFQRAREELAASIAVFASAAASEIATS